MQKKDLLPSDLRVSASPRDTLLTLTLARFASLARLFPFLRDQLSESAPSLVPRVKEKVAPCSGPSDSPQTSPS